MTIRSNSAEGQSSGTALSQANSGGGSGDIFDALTGGGSCVYSNAQAAHGSQSYLVNEALNQKYATWSGFTSSNSAAKMYVRFVALPTVAADLLQLPNTAGSAVRFFVTATTGRIGIAGPGGTLTTFASTLSLNTWYRLDLYAVKGTTTSNGTVIGGVYPLDSTTPVDAIYSASNVNAGTTDFTGARFMKLTGGSTALNAYFDTLVYESAATGMLGPANVSVTAVEATATATALAPTVAGGAAVAVVAATVTAQALPPTVSAIAVASVTAVTATATATALPPTVAGGASIAVPVATLTATAHPTGAPGTGAAVTAPAATATATALAPAVTGGAAVTAVAATATVTAHPPGVGAAGPAAYSILAGVRMTSEGAPAAGVYSILAGARMRVGIPIWSILAGVRMVGGQPLTVDAGLAETLDPFEMNTMTASVTTIGQTADSWTWALVSSSNPKVTAVVLTPGAAGAVTYQAPPTLDGTVLTFRATAHKAGIPDSSDTVVKTIRCHSWPWEPTNTGTYMALEEQLV